jgi:hypothetical protein
MTVFTGVDPHVTKDIENYINEEYNQLMDAFSLQYKDSEGNVSTELPTDVGTYTVQIVANDSDILHNYDVKYRTMTLIIKSLSLETSEPTFLVEGQFGTKETLNVKKVNGSKYNSTVSEKYKGYSVVAAYEIADPIETEREQITFRVEAPTNVRNVKLLYNDGSGWQEVSYTLEGNYMVFKQTTMASAYIVCARRAINWLLIGLIVGGVLVAGGIVVVVLMLKKNQRSKVLAESASKQLAAPTVTAEKVDENDELDSFIETFDESTVERELTPAERIALREKEEKYQQYKSRLERLRSSDRTMNETLAALGLEKNADDEEIIARMIAEDEERARKVEEELRREEEEAKAREEEANRTVILERREDEVLEQKTFAPTLTDLDNDDDIDI